MAIETEKAPSAWTIVNDYSKTAITLATGFLGLTITFQGQLTSGHSTFFERALLAGTWTCLVISIAFGLLVTGRLSGFLQNAGTAWWVLCWCNLSFLMLFLAAGMFLWFACLRLYSPVAKPAEVAVQRALDFMPSFYHQASPRWDVKSIVSETGNKSYEVVISEETTKARFSITLSESGQVIKATKTP
jgi:hypothetical protein